MSLKPKDITSSLNHTMVGYEYGMRLYYYHGSTRGYYLGCVGWENLHFCGGHMTLACRFFNKAVEWKREGKKFTFDELCNHIHGFK